LQGEAGAGAGPGGVAPSHPLLAARGADPWLRAGQAGAGRAPSPGSAASGNSGQCTVPHTPPSPVDTSSSTPGTAGRRPAPPRSSSPSSATTPGGTSSGTPPGSSSWTRWRGGLIGFVQIVFSQLYNTMSPSQGFTILESLDDDLPGLDTGALGQVRGILDHTYLVVGP
jgi:hypothetical protein